MRLRRKYLGLGVGEFLAATVFGLIGALQIAPALDTRSAVAWWAALGPLLLILLQAGCYWLLARGWLLRESMPAPLARAFLVLRMINVVVLLAGLIITVVFGTAPWPMIGFVLVWAFGVVEFVNYFVMRLAYPIRSWSRQVARCRSPRLIIDINQALRNR